VKNSSKNRNTCEIESIFLDSTKHSIKNQLEKVSTTRDFKNTILQQNNNLRINQENNPLVKNKPIFNCIERKISGIKLKSTYSKASFGSESCIDDNTEENLNRNSYLPQFYLMKKTGKPDFQGKNNYHPDTDKVIIEKKDSNEDDIESLNKTFNLDKDNSIQNHNQ